MVKTALVNTYDVVVIVVSLAALGGECTGNFLVGEALYSITCGFLDDSELCSFEKKEHRKTMLPNIEIAYRYSRTGLATIDE